MTVLSGLIKAHGWQVGAELGVWQGALFGHLLGRHPELYLTGVDHWRAEGLYAAKDMQHAHGLALSVSYQYLGRCRILQTDTVEAARYFDDGALDFVFIDASHDTPSVRADIHAWRPKVRKGGALTGHDANLQSVRRALDLEFPSRWKLLGANVWICPCE